MTLIRSGPLHLPVNTELACRCGANAALLYAHLCRMSMMAEAYKGYVSHEKHGEYLFPCSLDDVQETIGLSPEKQETALKALKKAGYLYICVIGLPGKRHFRLEN